MSIRQSLLSTITTAVLVLAAAFDAPIALAQDQEGGLQEVTVSATRRADINLQEAPLAVTAVTSEQIQNIVPRDVSEISAVVPNFSAARITAFNAASFSMRGAGQTDIIVYLEPPVAVLVDDFVVSSVQTQLLDTWDLDSVEVLRGPQGTLFGKNTTGGAVVLRTKRPDLLASSGEIQLGLGSFGRRQINGAINMPLVEDKFALRVVGSSLRTDGFYKNAASFGPTVGVPLSYNGLSGRAGGERAGGYDVTNGRIKALWQPTETFSALLQYEILRDTSDSVPSVNDTPSEPGCVPFVTCRFLWNSLGYRRETGDPINSAAVTNRNDVGLRMGRGQIINVDGAYLNLQWDINDRMTLYSVTGRREQESRLPNTYTGEVPVHPMFGVISLFDATRDDNRETFQQEVRLNYKTDRTNWVFGGFYQDEDVGFCVLQVLGFLDQIDAGAGTLPENFFNTNPQVLCNRQEAKVLAAFADVTFDISEKFQLAVGARITDEEKKWQGRSQVPIPFLTNPPDFGRTIASLTEPLDALDFVRFPNLVSPVGTRDWNEPSWRVTGSYKFSDDVFGYATVARGFKSGGFNDQTGTTGNAIATTGPGAFGAYDPEFATSFEVGLKTELLDRRLRLNTALFMVKYEDAQRALVSTITNSLGVTFQETRFFNAAEVEVKGIELEATAAVTDQFTIGLTLGYQDGDYKRFEADSNGDGQITNGGSNGMGGTFPVEVFTNQPLARTPKFQGSLSLNYDLPLDNGGNLKWNALLHHEDENLFILSDLGEQFNGNLDQKNLLGINMTYMAPDENWWVRLYGKNLTDERYRVAVQPVANLWTHAQFGEPRSYGIDIGMKFGGEKPAPVRRPIDSDGDGVTDDIDRCPGTPAGTAVDASGCPLPKDSDGDGVTDDRDRCPNTPAGARVDANGCELDADGDGVVDRLDQCPNTPAGAKVDANGCELDSDGDGVVDSKDQCPDTPKGDRVDVYGCSFKTEIKLPGVVFETNKADLKGESLPVLDGAVATLKRYPELIVEVAGHTDAQGSDGYNLTLSKSRAETVMKYLTDNGVTNTLRARGYGERQPVASNKTEEGRQANRRVVLRILEK